NTKYTQLWDNDQGLKPPGAGDMFGSVLDVSIVALSLPMYRYRNELKARFMTIIVPNVIVSIGSLFAYPTFCYHIGISAPRGLAFASRSLTLALATPATKNLGGDPFTIAPLCIFSGIAGVIVGPIGLDLLRIPKDDYITRGITLGANSSAVATALLLTTDPRAAAFSSLSMGLLGTITVALTSVPPLVHIIRSLVGINSDNPAMTMAGGEANSYYQMPDGDHQKDYPMQPQQAYHQNGQYHQQNYQEPYQNGQGYSQPPPNYGQNFNPRPDMNGYDNKPTFEQAFKIDKPKWNDWWAGLLFLAVFAGYVAVSGIALQGYAATKGFNGGGIYDSNNDFGLDTNTIVLFVFCLAMAMVLSYIYVWLARAFTKQFIWITGIIHIIAGFATAIYMLSRKYWSGGIVFLIFAIFTVVCFISWIPRIPFSVVMLQTSIDVSKKFGHVYLVSLVGGVLATALGAWFSVTFVAVYVKYEPGANPACSTGAGGCSSAKVIGLLVFITFAMYWISEFL
ncbi:DUF580-domain-containing protein, partial [Aureobasidium melanogenum]